MKSITAILDESSQIITKERYDKAWATFIQWVGVSADNQPGEDDFANYLNFLKTQRKFAASTLWSHYSMLNRGYQVKYGLRLQSFPRLTLLMKGFESGYVRKTSSIFSKAEIDKFLCDAPNLNEYIHLKMTAVVSFSGGLRCADLIKINVDDIQFDDATGYWISYDVSKQLGERKKNQFNVSLGYSVYITAYKDKLNEQRLWAGNIMKTFRIKKDGTGYYTRQPMG